MVGIPDGPTLPEEVEAKSFIDLLFGRGGASSISPTFSPDAFAEEGAVEGREV